jgi:hypothetical protein
MMPLSSRWRPRMAWICRNFCCPGRTLKEIFGRSKELIKNPGSRIPRRPPISERTARSAVAVRAATGTPGICSTSRWS